MTVKASTNTLGYVPSLDGLRGIAIASVVAYHAFGWPRGGWIGVQLFFVLSGFLITTLLLEERAATGGVRLRAFYARRARRLLPALAALLAGYLVIAAARGSNGLGDAARWGLYAGNVYAAFWPGAAAHLDGLNHLWSLAQEEQFYLVWPAALLLVARTRHAAAFLVGLAVALMLYRLALVQGGASDARISFAPDLNVEGLVLGAALAFRPAGVSRRLVAAAAAAVLPIYVLFPNRGVLDVYTLPLVELASVAFVAAAVCGTLTLPRPLIRLGRISYSLYLWHFVVLWAFGWQRPVLAVALSVAAAAVSTRWIEQPLRRSRAARARLPGVPVPAASA
jgi:peptidoglycan/LPS O-acetylase OafA/YrhL